MTAPDVPTGEHVERFSVSLTRKNSKGLEAARKIRDETKTHALNNAVALYADLVKLMADGGEVWVWRPGADKADRMYIIG